LPVGVRGSSRNSVTPDGTKYEGKSSRQSARTAAAVAA